MLLQHLAAGRGARLGRCKLWTRRGAQQGRKAAGIQENGTGRAELGMLPAQRAPANANAPKMTGDLPSWQQRMLQRLSTTMS